MYVFFFISVSPEINMHNYWRVSAVVISYENTYTNPYFPLPSPYFSLPSPYHPLLSSTIPLPSLYHPSTVPLPSLYHPSTIPLPQQPSLYHPSTVPLPSLYRPLPPSTTPCRPSTIPLPSLCTRMTLSVASLLPHMLRCLMVTQSVYQYWRVSAAIEEYLLSRNINYLSICIIVSLNISNHAQPNELDSKINK